ncbi:ATP-binding protein [Glycomyces sp. A-F 0318]|uniref:ATP-binding protein n=1 Tax=Glycomyces amatae TaxID=2881355 RepID=UPI001E2D35BF|nr:ATP-binding protein [Glycomyces amatae]MCD0445786.1 ATP-binding protein [Glycomyces amatae]
MPNLLPRRALTHLNERVDVFRAVVVGGPRQAGKTTLLRQLHAERGGTFATLDDPTVLQTVRADPSGFAGYGSAPRIFDEVQRGGDDLLLAVKRLMDLDDAPGQFVLSGSTRFLTVPTLSESLAGRAVFVDLWPLSAAERTRSEVDAPALLFDRERLLQSTPVSQWGRSDYFKLICEGGYPEAIRIRSESLRADWFDSYVSTVVLRDVAEFADIRHANLVPQLLRLVAARSGSNLVFSDLAKSLELNHATVRDYLGYLDIVYLTAKLPTWSTNLTSKLIKTPKAYVTDSGLTASLLGADLASVSAPGHPLAGPLVETFVFAELTRQLTVSAIRAGLHFYRDRDGREIDFVLERRDGAVVAIEVKASATVRSDSFKHLHWLRDRLGDRFHAGYVLYLGEELRPFGPDMAAVPLSALWSGEPLP